MLLSHVHRPFFLLFISFANNKKQKRNFQIKKRSPPLQLRNKIAFLLTTDDKTFLIMAVVLFGKKNKLKKKMNYL